MTTDETMLAYFNARCAAMRQRQVFGDILPDHPVWGPFPSAGEWFNIIAKVVFIPAAKSVFENGSWLLERLQERE